MVNIKLVDPTRVGCIGKKKPQNFLGMVWKIYRYMELGKESFKAVLTI